MDGNHKDLFTFIYKTFCLIGAIITASWCCFEYSKNEDICDVYFKRFLEDEESVYPEMTIVVPQQFNETKLQTLFGKRMKKFQQVCLKQTNSQESVKRSKHTCRKNCKLLY